MAGYTLDEVNAFPDAPAQASTGYSFDELNTLPDAPAPEETGLVRSFAKAIVDPLSKIGGSVAKTLLPKSMEGSLAGGQVGSVLGGKVDVVGYRDGRELKGAEFAKDLAGTALEGASYLPLGGVAVKGAKLASKTFKAGKVANSVIPKIAGLATEGALGGGLVGVGSALQRNEDTGTVLQEGAFGAGLGAIGGPLLGHYAPKAVGSAAKALPELMTKEGRLARNIAKREKDIYDIETGYTKLNQKNAYKEDARNESRSRIASTDVLVNTVDNDGKINTKAKGGAIDQYKAQTIDGKENVVKNLLQKEGKLINIDDVSKYLEKTILGDEKLAGGSLESAYSRVNSTIRGLARKADENGNIPLDLLHSAKISETANINYSVPSSKAEAKAVARGLKELIENNSGQNIKEINDELAKYYSDIEMLADLDGRRVKGGRLGKYFATGTGNIIGGLAGMATGGPVGGAIGAAVGGEATSRIMGAQMAKTFGKALGKKAEKSKILQKAEQKTANLPLTLPAPKFGRDYVNTQEYNRGIPKRQYNNAQTTIKNAMPSSISSKPELQGVDKEAFDSMNYYFDNTDGPQKVRYFDKASGDYKTYRTSTTMADFPDHLKARALFNRVKPYWDKQEAPESPLMKELYDELVKRMNAMKAKIEKVNNTPSTGKMPDGSAFAGVPAGIGQDEDGNTTFNPKMAALGMIGGHIAGKSNILAKAKGSKLEEFIVKARKETGKTDEALTNIWKNANKSNVLANVTKHDKDVVKALADAKGMSAEDIMAKNPDIQLKRDVVATDLDGKKITIPEGEALTPYEMKGGKVVLQDGETYVVSKNQYANIKGNAISTEKPKNFFQEFIDNKVEEKVYTKDFQGRKLTPEENTELNDLSRKLTYDGLEGKEKDRWNELMKVRNEQTAPRSDTKYSSYTLPGGTNYKEILIKAPVVNFNQDSIAQKIYKKNWNELEDYQKREASTFLNDKNYSKDIGKNFQSSHWSEDPNVLSHIRMADHKYNDKKVALLEEIQSDWAREGRAKGFIDPEFQTKKDAFNKNGVLASQKDEYEALMKSPSGVPNNPLLKNWQEMSIKRALKEAVDNDAEYFAWTNGAQTKARYNLSKDIENVNWGTRKTFDVGPGGTKGVKLIPKNTANRIEFSIDDNGVIKSVEDGTPVDWKGKKLDEVIGKGLADKIMADESGKLAGEGLNFGGEWADALYDRQVPNIVKDLTGAKVEMLDMGLSKGGKQLETYKKDLKNLEEATDVVNKEGKIAELKKEIAKLESNPDSQMGIKLTPEIKAMIRGEAPTIKKSSGKSPFGKAVIAGGVALGGAGLASADTGDIKFGEESVTEKKLGWGRYRYDKVNEPTMFDGDAIIKAIVHNETGTTTKNPYSFSKWSDPKAGPLSKYGKDLGKYQITSARLKEQSKKFLGRVVSDKEFLASPELQDKFIESQIRWLKDKGLTPEQIIAVHRHGWGDLSKEAVESAAKKRKDYVDNSIAFIKGNK